MHSKIVDEKREKNQPAGFIYGFTEVLFLFLYFVCVFFFLPGSTTGILATSEFIPYSLQ